jgi:hypothetical protein
MNPNKEEAQSFATKPRRDHPTAKRIASEELRVDADAKRIKPSESGVERPIIRQRIPFPDKVSSLPSLKQNFD